jgi:hypothetical protein
MGVVAVAAIAFFWPNRPNPAIRRLIFLVICALRATQPHTHTHIYIYIIYITTRAAAINRRRRINTGRGRTGTGPLGKFPKTGTAVEAGGNPTEGDWCIIVIALRALLIYIYRYLYNTNTFTVLYTALVL